MNLKEDIKPISYIKSNAAEVLKRVNDTHNPMIITQKEEAKAILLDTESYDDINRSVGILKLLSQSENEIATANTIDQKNVFIALENKFGFYRNRITKE